MITKMSRVLALFFFSLLLPGAAMPLSAQGSSSNSIPIPGSSAGGSTYLIQPNDLLEIYVNEEPTWTRKVTVQPDGWISINLVQDVKAAGLTTSQLKAALEKRLADYKKLPNVTVILEAVQSYKVFVTGKVAKSGVLQSEKPITVLQAISLAGGLTEYAKKEEIVIIRTSGPVTTKIPFNYTKVSTGENLKDNILLESGDNIVVP